MSYVQGACLRAAASTKICTSTTTPSTNRPCSRSEAKRRKRSVNLLAADITIININPTLQVPGKYSKRRRSNVAVIIVRIVFIISFFFYCLLLNHSFQTNPNKITNCFNFSLYLQLYNYIAPASLFDF